MMRFGGRGTLTIKRMLLAALAVAASVCLASSAEAGDPLRIAVQKTGTASWEIEVIKARGLDKAANLDIETIELASTDAAKVALMGGAADMVAEDWLWAARERALGDKLLFTPYSTTLGAVMAPKDSPIHTVADLAGRSIGVAGGPLDKSWLFCGRSRSALGSTSPRRRGRHMARRRSSPRNSSRARLTLRSNTGTSPPILRGVASAARLKCPMSRRRSAQAARSR